MRSAATVKTPAGTPAAGRKPQSASPRLCRPGRSAGGRRGPAAGRKPQPVSPLVTRWDQLVKMLRPTPHVPLAVEGMNLFAKLEYVTPVGSIKDRPAYWILRRAAERGEICDQTTVIESSSGNFAVALAAFTRLLGLRFIPVIDPHISHTYH